MSNTNLKINYLKWATIVMPALLVWLYETVRHSNLVEEALVEEWPGNLIAAFVVLAISFGFAQITFGRINQMQAVLAEQNRQLRKLNLQIKELAIVEERRRLSCEIHDGLAQLLAYIMLKIDLIEGLLQPECLLEANHELELVRQACNNAYDDVRETITNLRPELFEGRSFLNVLQSLLEQFADTSQTQVQLQFDGFDQHHPAQTEVDQLVGAATIVQLSRVIQEALSNVRKHAAAKQLKVTLSLAHSKSHPLRVTIADDGRGFDPSALPQAKRQHFGHLIMRERIESLNGTFEVHSSLGHGTIIQIGLPAETKAVGVAYYA